MALINSFEKNGNLLFRYRGQIPVILFVMAVPAIMSMDYTFLMDYPWLGSAVLVFSIGISVTGQVIRSIAIGTSNKYTSGRNTQEQVADALNTKGIYSTVRHPLYLGNFFMWMGIVVFTMNAWFIIVVSLLFWIYYERIMFAEERFLERKFGEQYISWSNHVPAFWPSFKKYEKTQIPFSFKTTLRREYSGISATILGFVFVDFVRVWWLTGTPKWLMIHGVVVLASLLLSFILRTLKHKTKLLHEEDRS